MARGNNQKLKLIRLAQIMLEKTDDTHFITMPEIMSELEKYEVTAERKSIYSDLKELENMGIEVEGEQRGKLYYYHVVGRQFELPELKLLVDSIQASKFVTAKKTNELIKKLETLCSEHEAKQLQRQIFVDDRVKARNESIYYSVDAIHNAIASNKKITFQYFNWNIRKEMELRHNGEFYIISPWALSYDDENYYLVGYDSKSEKIKHYRVDKMLKIDTCDEAREGKELFKSFNIAEYSKKNFAMFGGEEEGVTVKLSNDMCGVFIDRFGKDITFVPIDNNNCTVHLNVAMSSHFFGWIFALGDKVSIVGPPSVVKSVKKEIERLVSQYE